MSNNNILQDMPPVTQIQNPISHTSLPPTDSQPTITNPLSGPAASPQPRTTDSNLNPRSCVTCRRRKVRCNKREPCSNCVKAGIECVFPGPGRAPRKPRRPPDVELLSRLRKLEGVVESLGGTGAIEKLLTTNNQTGDPKTTLPALPPFQAPPKPSTNFKEPTLPKEPEPTIALPKQNNTNEELGRLVIDESKSLYVSNRYWTTIGDQIEELQDILDSPSEDESENTASPENSPDNQRSGDAFIFGYNSLANTLRNYHPTPTQAFILWKTYEQNVAPLLTIVHKPTVRNILVSSTLNLESLDKSNEALVFSIYLAAVISMTPEQCLTELGDDRDSTISRFRFATEQGLARANLLNSRNINLLQAAVLFISCIRREDRSRFVWTMSAIMLRLASGLGIHRDGTNFGLSPFETEMRRRLWWHICIIDVRAAEDHGTDPMINEMIYDTKLPLNINDDDISPDSKTFPIEKVGFTEMTFTLIRCQVSVVYRLVTYISPGQNSVEITLEQRKKTIEELHNTLNDKYNKYCDMQEPLQWACATMARLAIAKLWLVVHQPMIKTNLPTLSPIDRNRILLTSIEVIEFTHLLEISESTKHWSWMFGAYVQWHAIAFVLAELCVRPRCPGVDRAWVAIDSIFHEWERTSKGKKGSLWRPLTKLLNKAKDFRARQAENPKKGCPYFDLPPTTTTDQLYLRSPLQSQLQLQQLQLQRLRHSRMSGSPDFNDGSLSQLSGLGQISHTSDLTSPISSVLYNNALPTNPVEPPKNRIPEFSLDLSRDMPELLNDILPAWSMIPSDVYSPANNSTNGTSGTSGTSGINGAATSNLKSVTASSFSPVPSAFDNNIRSDPFNTPVNWDQVDDAMRDFHQEFEQATGQDPMDYQVFLL